MTDDIADWDAAYVLGALSLDDWHTYEAYLAANPERATALTELAGLPGILNVLSRDEAVALTAPATPQRRSRRSLVAAGRGSRPSSRSAPPCPAAGTDARRRDGTAGHAVDPEGRHQRRACRDREEVGHPAGLDVRLHRGLGQGPPRPTTSS